MWLPEGATEKEIAAAADDYIPRMPPLVHDPAEQGGSLSIAKEAVRAVAAPFLPGVANAVASKNVDTGIPLSPGVNQVLSGSGQFLTGRGRGIQQALTGGEDVQRRIDEAVRLDQPLYDKGLASLGRMGTAALAMAPLSMAAGANVIPQTIAAATEGAALGATDPIPTGSSYGRGERAFDQALLSAATNLGLRGAGFAVSPSQRAEAAKLLKRGVRLTPGQLLGESAQGIETFLARQPIMGGTIRAGQRDAIKSWNASVFKGLYDDAVDAAERIKKGVIEAPKEILVGEGGLEQAHSFVRKMYSAAIDDMGPSVPIGSSSLDRMLDAVKTARPRAVLPTSDMREQVADFVRREFDALRGQKPNNPQFSSAKGQGFVPLVDGEDVKKFDAALGQEINRLRRGENTRGQSRILREAREAFWDDFAKFHPESRELILAANRTRAQLGVIDRAADAAASQDFVFTPTALKAAHRARAPKDVAPHQRAGGSYLDGTSDAEKVLGRTLPVPPNAVDALGTLATTGALGLVSPTLAIPPIAFALGGTRPGKAILRGMLSAPGPGHIGRFRQGVGQFIRRGSGAAAPAIVEEALTNGGR
jgi:hypothetical protein